ncbi:MAG TPA: glycosyltransferase family 39 protein [bacterium]|nr:glycosyltransferase family 39 protein [bacterium]
MKTLNKNKEIIVLSILAGVFFVFYSFLPLAQIIKSEVPFSQVGFKFNTPDEVTNYYFTKLYKETDQLYYVEPYNLMADGVVFPRWAKPVQEKVVPGTFQGLMLIYGTLAKIFSTWSILFLTPFFAVLGVVFFYLLLKLWFEKKTAFVSAVLMFVFPGFWYYASRTLFHNVLFLTLLLAGLYFLVNLLQTDPLGEYKLKSKRKLFFAVMGGLCMGGALITRSSEFVWVFLMVFGILIFYRQNLKFNLTYLTLSFLFFCLCGVPVLHNNKTLYGSYLASGYSQMVSSNLEDLAQIQPIGLTQALLLPFGFHPRVMVNHVFAKYFWQLFWPWILFFIGGMIVFFKNKKTSGQKLYFYLFLVTGYLMPYYGSWFFQDSLNPRSVSIGSSYIRYFLPLFIFALPFIALLLIKISEVIKIKNKKIILIGLIFVLTAVAIDLVYFKGEENLIAIKDNLLRYRLQAQDVIAKTQPNDIILMDVSNDKVVFPERQHVVVPQGGAELLAMSQFLKITNVYFLYRPAEINLEYLNQTKFYPYNLEIYDKQEVRGGGILFNVRQKAEYYVLNN